MQDQNFYGNHYKSNGSGITLPSADTKRWVISRKEQVVKAIQAGVLSAEDACERYDISMDELHAWQKLIKNHGSKALRVTKIKKYRHLTKNEPSNP